MENNLQPLSRSFSTPATNVPETPGQHRSSVVNAIIQINGLIPVFLRTKNGETWYDLPGGKPDPIDPNDPTSRLETIFETVVRELREELGIEASADHEVVVDSMAHPYISGAMKTFVHCNYISGVPYNRLPDEHIDMFLMLPSDAIKSLGNRISPAAAIALLDLSREAANQPDQSVTQQRPAVFGT